MTTHDLVPAIDMEHFNEIFGGRGTSERELLTTVSTGITRQVSEMATHLRSNNLSAITDASHKLKGSARSVGLTPLGDVCEAIELAARACEADAVSGFQARFQVEGDRACLALSEIQRQL